MSMQRPKSRLCVVEVPDEARLRGPSGVQNLGLPVLCAQQKGRLARHSRCCSCGSFQKRNTETLQSRRAVDVRMAASPRTLRSCSWSLVEVSLLLLDCSLSIGEIESVEHAQYGQGILMFLFPNFCFNSTTFKIR